MKLILENFKKFVNEEELEGSSETDVIDDFLSAPVGEESSELTEGQMDLWFILQNFEMIATIASAVVGTAVAGAVIYQGLDLEDKIFGFLKDRQINAREAAIAAREKAEKEQAEAELVLLTDFLLDDPTFIAALDGLVTSGSRKDVIAFNKSVRGKIKELGSMINSSPEALLRRLRKKADAGEIEQRVVSDFEEKVSSADPEQDVEALRKAEPASLSSRQRQKIKESKTMKITKARLRQMIKEEVDAMRGADRPGAGIEDIPQPESEEPIDVLMDVKARLAGMSDEELMQLAADLDGDMVTALRHILSDKMYAPTGDSDMLPQIGDDPRDQSPL